MKNFEDILNRLRQETDELDGCQYFWTNNNWYTDFYNEHGIECDYWDNDNKLCQIARFMIDSRILSKDDTTSPGENESQLLFDTHANAEDYNDEQYNSHYNYASPYVIISRMNKEFLFEIYDIECDYKEKEVNHKMISHFVVPITDELIEDIKSSYYYAISKNFDEKTVDDLAEEIRQNMEIKENNCYTARNNLIDKYGQSSHARLTWVMYNIVLAQQ